MIAASKSSGTVMRLMEFERGVVTSGRSIGMYNTRDKSFFTVLRGKGSEQHIPSVSNDNMYTIAFSASYTDTFIQPAELYNNEHIEYLWMDGNLKDEEVEKLQAEGQTEDKWPVRLLLRHILGANPPIGIDGRFACMYSDGMNMYAFRNDFGSLFCDDNLTVCTRPFSGSTTLPANKMYRIDFTENKFVSISEFETVHRMEF
jgi:hypothetical protein